MFKAGYFLRLLKYIKISSTATMTLANTKSIYYTLLYVVLIEVCIFIPHTGVIQCTEASYVIHLYQQAQHIL